MATDSRERMVRAAAALFQERGYAATSFQDVIVRSGAPRGSIYHHFPGGKEELAVEALRWYAQRTSATLTALTARDGAVEAVAGFVAVTREALRNSDFSAGCPVAGVALDLADRDDPLRPAVADAFADWRRVLVHSFTHGGASRATARRLATYVVAAIEGALILARAERDTKPLDDVGRELLAHLRAVMVTAR